MTTFTTCMHDQMLESNREDVKLEAMRCITVMIAKGKTSVPRSLFPHIVKNVSSKNPELKKLIYLYLTNFADQEPDLALLPVATLQKSLKSPNPLIRSSALKVLTSMRLNILSAILMATLRNSVNDLSPYVRKTVAHSIMKIYRLDSSLKGELVEYIERLLNDKNSMVLSSAVATYEVVCPERLDLVQRHYRRFCFILADCNEWGQTIMLKLLMRYIIKTCRKDSKIVCSDSADRDPKTLLRSAKPLVHSDNSGVVMAVIKLYIAIANHNDVRSIITKPLIRLLCAHREIQLIVLTMIYNLITMPEREVVIDTESDDFDDTPSPKVNEVEPVQKNEYENLDSPPIETNKTEESQDHFVQEEYIAVNNSVEEHNKDETKCGPEEPNHANADNGEDADDDGEESSGNDESDDDDEEEENSDDEEDDSDDSESSDLSEYTGQNTFNDIDNQSPTLENDSESLLIDLSANKDPEAYKEMFRPYIKSFFIKHNDCTQIRLAKLKILTNLASSVNISLVLRELQAYISTYVDDREFVSATIHAIGRCAIKINEVAHICLNGLTTLLSNNNEHIVSEAIVVLRSQIIEKAPGAKTKDNRVENHDEGDSDTANSGDENRSHQKNERDAGDRSPSPQEPSDDDKIVSTVIKQVTKLLPTVAAAQARATILWILAEFCDKNRSAAKYTPNVLRQVAKTFCQEDNFVKLQSLTLVSKFLLSLDKELKPDLYSKIQLLAGYLFSLAKYDMDHDIRDRGRFLKKLLENESVSIRVLRNSHLPLTKKEDKITADSNSNNIGFSQTTVEAS